MAKWEQSPLAPAEEKKKWQTSSIDPESLPADTQTSEQIYDASVDAQIPINESENLFALTNQPEIPVSDSVTKRLGKQFYNATVGNLITNIGVKSEVGKLGTDVNRMAILEDDFRRRVEAGQPVTEQDVEYFTKPYKKGTFGSLFNVKQAGWKQKAWTDYQEGNLNIGKIPTPQEAIQKLVIIEELAEQKTFQQTNVLLPVSEPTKVSDKIVDAIAGIAGFITQIAIMKKVSPSMPDWLVWENIHQANGGKPGGGAAMQLALGGLNRLIPGVGFLPAVERGTIGGAFFGTTTYLGGGDTVDVLISAGIPFAFESIGLTRQSWAKYKNKKEMIQTIKEKAPSLKNLSDIEIEKAVSGLLSDEQMLTEFKPKKAAQSISQEVKNHIQQKQYDELLTKANSGDKKAVQQLNDYIQGKNIPTYDELLERGFNGDTNAFDLINAGQYKGGKLEPAPELKIPKAPRPIVAIESPAQAKEALNKEVFMKGFAARLTSIRNNADNIVAKAGKKSQQIEIMKKDLTSIEKHYESISETIGKNQQALSELSKIKDILPEYSKAINDFVSKPSKEKFEKIKIIGDEIGKLGKAYGEQISTEAAKQLRPKTPIEKIKEQVKFAENADVKKTTLSEQDLKKARERGFITSAKEVLPELKIEGQYIPRSTDTLAIKAKNLILDKLDMAEKLARSGTDDKAVATASELIKFYGEKGRSAKSVVEADIFYEKAANVASDVATTLTEAGRTVQAASILGRMTPEGQVRFAAREIQRYNEKIERTKGGLGALKKKIPELTGKQAKYILDEMNGITKMPEGKQKHIRFQALQDHMAELVPTSLYKKMVTVWKAGLLTGIKTSGLNIFANVGHLGTEIVKDIPAVAVDKVASYFTGERTIAPTIKGLGKGSIEGLGNGIEYIRTGYSSRDIGLKFDVKKISYGKGNLAKALRAGTETVFRILGAEDQPFYYAAKLRSMYEQAKVSAINMKLKGKAAKAHIDALMQNPTEKMIKYATKDAETAVFINQTKLGDLARGIQRLPGGEIIVPFGRTPSAVAMQIVNYSPIGIAKTIIENIGKGRFDQRAFSQGLGRGITGTAAMVIGATLFDNGLIALDRPTSEKERKLWEIEGRQPNSVKIGGKWRTVQSFGPAGNLLLIGAHFKRAFEETGSPTEAMSEALAGSAKSFTEQTFLKGVNQFVSALADPERSAPFVAGSMISSIVPTIVADIARATDVVERRTETIPEKVISRIPGARQTLEPQVTALGEERKVSGNPLELMIDPTRPSKDISTPVVTELRRLWDEGWEVSPNLLGTKKGYDVLTQQENTELWKRAGSLTNEALKQLVQNPQYAEIPDERKAELVSEIITQIQEAAKAEMVAKKIATAKKGELSNIIFEMRKSGLATQKIIPIALSKRNPRKARKEQK